MDQKGLIYLLNLYFDQALSGADKAELERVLLEEEEARHIFWEYAALHGVTHEAAKLKWADHGQPAPKPSADSIVPRAVNWLTRFPWIGGRWGWAGAAAGALALALLGLFLGGFFDPNVAVLARAVRAEWADGTNGPGPGMKLKAGLLHLNRGAVQINFNRGAHVVFEGPAEIRLLSEQKAFCSLGRFYVHVPEQARGFKMELANLEVTDLGTAFGLSLPPSQPAEVHVFSGRVDLARKGPNTAEVQLMEGEAVRVDPQVFTRLPADPDEFLNEAALAHWDDPETLQHLASWKKASDALNSDPSTILHYTFEGEASWDRTVTNQTQNAPPETYGNLVGCVWTEGRWPGKKAVRFDGDDDRIRLQLLQPLKSVTCLIWARVDGLPHGFVHSLMSGSSEGPGTLRWTISHDGEFRLGVGNKSAGPEARWTVAESDPVITTNLFGQWLMLAVVYDGKTATHYLNGEVKLSEALEGPNTLSFGSVEVGNWVATPDHPDFQWAKGKSSAFFNRDFLGCMDEVAVLARALPVEEIQRLYASGR